MWTNDDFKDDPCGNGWEIVNEEYKIQLKCPNDRLHKLPEQMMLGCFCKTECSRCECSLDRIQDGKCKCRTCKCFKNTEIQGCSIHTCKSCKCFKREKEGDMENIFASCQLQKMPDELTSEPEDTEEEEDDFVEQDGNNFYFDDFDDF